jgi:hypothetical protein
MVTNALTSLGYSYVCLFFDALLKRLLFLVTLHAVGHFQIIKLVYEKKRKLVLFEPWTKFNNLPTYTKNVTDAVPFK